MGCVPGSRARVLDSNALVLFAGELLRAPNHVLVVLPGHVWREGTWGLAVVAGIGAGGEIVVQKSAALGSPGKRARVAGAMGRLLGELGRGCWRGRTGVLKGRDGVLTAADWHSWACLGKLESIGETPSDCTRNPGVCPVTLCRLSVKLLGSKMEKSAVARGAGCRLPASAPELGRKTLYGGPARAWVRALREVFPSGRVLAAAQSPAPTKGDRVFCLSADGLRHWAEVSA